MIPDFIGTYENVLTPEQCEKIIARMEDFKNNGYGQTRPDDSTVRCDEAFFDSLDPFLDREMRAAVFEALWTKGYANYAKEFDILNTFAKHDIKEIKGQITKPGQGYHVWHPEITSADSCTRVLVYILYLNDVTEGAETEFLYYKKRIAPKQGTLIVFPAHFTHTHRGNNNLSEVNKYVLTGWYTFAYPD